LVPVRRHGYDAPVPADELTPEEHETAELVKTLIATGNFTPLVQLLHGEDGGPERARSALRLLGELALDLLVQLALETLVAQHGA